jgi:hypothetical protein
MHSGRVKYDLDGLLALVARRMLTLVMSICREVFLSALVSLCAFNAWQLVSDCIVSNQTRLFWSSVNLRDIFARPGSSAQK